MAKTLNEILTDIKCAFGFHDWDKPHTVYWGSLISGEISFWYYCKNKDCNKRKTEDYEQQSVSKVLDNGKDIVYERKMKLVSRSVNADPNNGEYRGQAA